MSETNQERSLLRGNFELRLTGGRGAGHEKTQGTSLLGRKRLACTKALRQGQVNCLRNRKKVNQDTGHTHIQGIWREGRDPPPRFQSLAFRANRTWYSAWGITGV